MICMQTQFVFICDNLCIRRCYPYPPPPVHLIIFSTEFNTQASGVCRCTVVVVGGGGAWGGGGQLCRLEWVATCKNSLLFIGVLQARIFQKVSVGVA